MTDPNPALAALLASGRRELAKHRVTHLHKPKPTPPEDTAVSHVDEPQPPIPAEGAPHAFVAVCRNPAAKHAAWWQDAVVIPAQSTEEQHYYTRQGYELLPIGPDGDTGTRAIVEEFRPAAVDPWLTVHPIVEQAISKAKEPTENRDGDSVYSRDNIAEAIRLLVAAIHVLDRKAAN